MSKTAAVQSCRGMLNQFRLAISLQWSHVSTHSMNAPKPTATDGFARNVIRLRSHSRPAWGMRSANELQQLRAIRSGYRRARRRFHRLARGGDPLDDLRSLEYLLHWRHCSDVLHR